MSVREQVDVFFEMRSSTNFVVNNFEAMIAASLDAESVDMILF